MSSARLSDLSRSNTTCMLARRFTRLSTRAASSWDRAGRKRARHSSASRRRSERRRDSARWPDRVLPLDVLSSNSSRVDEAEQAEEAVLEAEEGSKQAPAGDEVHPRWPTQL